MDHSLDLGDASAVEPGPWHYGADYITVYFEGERSKLRSLVPHSFEVNDITCMAYVCEIVSVAEGRADLVSSAPERTVYNEAAIGVKCSFAGKPGIYFPVMWVTTEWSLLRGLLNGYPKRLADAVHMTKLHPLNPGLKKLGVGTVLSGYCVKGPEQELRVSVSLERQGAASDLISFGATYGMRNFPSTDTSQSSVREAVEIMKSNSTNSDVWLGRGSLETSLDVGEPRPLSGAVYRSGFTILGSRVLKP
ncbi:MAG TPA: acetoacetate decarboxylase family protein [Nitrososphaerales archaeon]|nr:acetoacetate decarboxylase family protein [Nitrososphaerales archaeon]